MIMACWFVCHLDSGLSGESEVGLLAVLSLRSVPFLPASLVTEQYSTGGMCVHFVLVEIVSLHGGAGAGPSPYFIEHLSHCFFV